MMATVENRPGTKQKQTKNSALTGALLLNGLVSMNVCVIP